MHWRYALLSSWVPRPPQQEKVEADEEPPQPATVAHQREKGVGLLLPHHGHGVTGEHRDQN